MLDLAALALRNTLRNKRRTLLTMVSITVGCAAMICFAGFIAFTFEGLRETTIRTQLGHMQIYREGYFERRVSDPPSVMIEDAEALEAALAGVEGVLTVTGRLGFSGIGGTGETALNMRVTGVDPARETEFADFEILVDGRNLRPGDEDAGVVGHDLMVGLGAEVGDWVTMLTSTLDGVINAVDFRIVGVVRTGSKTYDAVFVKVPLSLAQRALGTRAVERVVVLLEDTAGLPGAAADIEARLAALDGRFETRAWHELAEFYRSVTALYGGLFRVFAAIVVVVVMFSVVNTMTMAVLERTSELSALRAMGARRRVVLGMILFEGTIIGIAGALAGLALGLGIAALIESLGGIAMPPPPAMSQGYQAYLKILPPDAALAMGLSVAAAFVSSLFPAVHAQNIGIVEGLRS